MVERGFGSPMSGWGQLGHALIEARTREATLASRTETQARLRGHPLEAAGLALPLRSHQ